MAYSLLKVTTFSRYYLNHFYERHPGLQDSTYAAQYSALMNDGFGWADFLSTNLKKIGVDSQEIVFNAGPLQRAWARERGVRARGTDLLVTQISHKKPDVVFFEDLSLFSDEQIYFLKERVNSIRLVAGYVSSPLALRLSKSAKAYDVFFCCGPAFTYTLKDIGFCAYELDHAFEPDILRRLDNNLQDNGLDLIFSGSLAPWDGFHSERIKVLIGLLGAGIDVKIYTDKEPYRPRVLFLKNSLYYLNRVIQVTGQNWLFRHPLFSLLRRWDSPVNISAGLGNLLKRAANPLYGLDMYRALAKAGIVLNVHADVAGNYAVNMRLFESTGVGGCLVTDHKKNIKDLFDPDHEVVTFRSIEEAIVKIRWLIDHPEKRRNIASAGQKRTLREYTFERRAAFLDYIIKGELSKR